MKFVDAGLGLNTADAESVTVRYAAGGELVLEYVDYREQPVSFGFADAIAFRWQEFDEEGIRDDVAYRVVDSPWLARQAELQAVPVEQYAHYKLCFNAAGCLDVLCRRVVP
jgi:hypothetical protein